MKIEQEIWKSIIITPFEGRYMISSYGRVKRLESRKAKKSFILKQANVNGYLAATLCYGHITKMFKVHRLVALHFKANPNNYPQINHIDGNKRNNCYTNLEWCNLSQNVTHAYSIGIMNTRGVKNGQSKLSEAAIISMREGYAKELETPKYYRGRKLKGFYFAKIMAKKYRMNAAYIYSILLKESWKHVK